MMKNKIAILTILAAMNFNFTEAAAIDEELAVIAAEQENSGEEKVSTEETPAPVKKSKRELKAEQKAAEKKRKEELKAAEKEIREAQKKSRDQDSKQLKISQRESTKKNFPTIDPVTPKIETVQIERPVAKSQDSAVETFTPPETPPATSTTPATAAAPATSAAPATPTTLAVTTTPENIVGLPNPIVMYTNFEELAHAVKFTPLYIPKKSGFTINSMLAIDGHTAEIRYGRRWEPEVSLSIRTYKRMNGEELKDISGVNGVKWRVDMTSGTTVYIAKIAENKHVAAWSAGNYTFSAQAENLSFAAFHAIVADELVDLSNHYYVG